MYYVGSTSESVGQNVAHLRRAMAFGGGGYAVSFPATAALAGIMDGCLDRYNELYLYGSDHRVQACLAELGVPLTREPGFHQAPRRRCCKVQSSKEEDSLVVEIYECKPKEPALKLWR
ncbi:hypothetical protein C2845_PM01G10550 [Panicum miliaceum]|uniref:Hexosyltransferase n=1 Tax=Panicum miliaceum TaxID=4540 RepID=A0A3L6TGG1_PANMI|nr:hypothetical protein C2845_PM01G10550 [Panicum miliaceum]